MIRIDTVGRKMAENLKQVYDWAEKRQATKMVSGEDDGQLARQCAWTSGSGGA